MLHISDMTEDNTNVFVKFLPPHIDDEELRELFAEFGTISSARVMRNIRDGSSLGYGYANNCSTTQSLIEVQICEVLFCGGGYTGNQKNGRV